MESVEGEDASSEGATRRQAGVASLFAVAVAGFSCLIGWELSAVFSPSLPLLSFCDIQTAIFIRCISVLTLAFAFGFFAVKADLFFKNRDRLAVAALIVSFLPMICACAYTATGALPIIVLEISWALLGISQAILATYWCVIFSLMESSFTMRVVVSGGVGGTFLFVIVNAAGEYARIVSHPLHFGLVCCDDCALHSEKLYPECAGFSPRARLVCSRVLFRRELRCGVWTYEH